MVYMQSARYWYGPEQGYHGGDPLAGDEPCGERPGQAFRPVKEGGQWNWAYDETLEPALMLPKSLVLRRMTDAQHDAFQAALGLRPSRDQALWAAISEVSTQDPVLRPELTALFGAEVAQAILAPPSAAERAAGWA